MENIVSFSDSYESTLLFTKNKNRLMMAMGILLAS